MKIEINNSILSFHILPNVIFILAVLGILLIILRHLPEATASLSEHERPIDEKLTEKGLPAKAVSEVRKWFKMWTKKSWNFVLEAKDLKPNAVAGYKIKKMFGGKAQQVSTQNSFPASFNPAPAQPSNAQPTAAIPTTQLPVKQEPSTEKNEEYFLELIKQDPKNLSNYYDLGKFYLDQQNLADAADIFRYLTSHQPGNADYHSRLAFCYYGLKEFSRASDEYKTSISLDPSQPNRYYNLGVSLEAEGKLEEAKDNLEQAIHLEPKNGKYYITLSNILLKTGNKAKAKQVLLLAKKLDPENRQVFEKLKQLV